MNEALNQQSYSNTLKRCLIEQLSLPAEHVEALPHRTVEHPSRTRSAKLYDALISRAMRLRAGPEVGEHG